jgi:hypothetical protein
MSEYNVLVQFMPPRERVAGCVGGGYEHVMTAQKAPVRSGQMLVQRKKNKLTLLCEKLGGEA